MHPPPRQLEVVTDDEQGAHDDERQQSDADPCDADDTDHHRPGQPEHAGNDQRGPGQVRAQRPAVELVQGVGTHAHGEKEGQQRPYEPAHLDMGRQAGADHDVAQMPGRVRGVEHRPPLAPPAACGGVERGALDVVASALVSHRPARPSSPT